MAQKIATTLTEIEKNLSKILEDKEGAIKSFMDLSESAKARIEAATIEAETAFNSADEKTYHKALDEKRTNEDLLAMYLHKADEIRNAPYITKEELDQIASKITTTLDAYMEEQLKDYTQKLESMLAQRDDINRMITHANSILGLAQKQLYKDPCGATSKSGEFIPHLSKEMKYQNISLYAVLDEIVKNNYNYALLSQTHDRAEIMGQERGTWIK